MPDSEDKIIADIESRVRTLEESVRLLHVSRDDDRTRIVELAAVVRDVQTDLALLRGLPGQVADLRDRLGKVEAALSVHAVRFDRVDQRLSAIEQTLGKIVTRVGLTGITTPVAVGAIYGLVELMRAVGVIGR